MAHLQLSEYLAHLQLAEDVVHLQLSEDLAHLQLEEDVAHLQLSEDLAHLQLSEDVAHLQLSEDLAYFNCFCKTDRMSNLHGERLFLHRILWGLSSLIFEIVSIKKILNGHMHCQPQKFTDCLFY